MRHVIKPHRPRRQALFVTLGISLLILLGWWGVNSMNSQWLQQRGAIRASQRVLSQKHQTVEKENETLREKVAMLERSIQIDQKAHAEVQAHIKELQNQLLDQKEELEFYQAILESAGAGQGVRVQGFRIEPAQEQGDYRYRLVLTHLAKEGAGVKGEVSIILEGGTKEGSSRKSLSPTR
jgi:chromosome segregation ATPase